MTHHSPFLYSRELDADIMVDATAVEEEENRDGPTVGTGRQVAGAAAVGGLVGLCFVGPVVALVAAGGAAVIATSRGKAGEVARSTGEVAANAGDRLQQLNRKHKVVEKTSNGIVNGCRWMSHKLKKPSTATST